MATWLVVGAAVLATIDAPFAPVWVVASASVPSATLTYSFNESYAELT
jgi:hypothetical protein